MATLTIQPSTIDSYIHASLPTTNFGSAISLYIQTGTTAFARSLINFDFSSLSDGASISAATLELYVNYCYTPRTYWLYELTRTTWTELGCTWNTYDGINAWTTPGGDYAVTNGVSIVISTTGWVSLNVLSLIQHFQSVHSKIANFLIKDETEYTGGSLTTTIRSKDYTADLSLRPKLIITYALIPLTKSLSDSITLSESKIKKPVAKKSEGITIAEAKTLKPLHPVSGDTLTLSEASIRKPRPVRAETFALTDILEKVSSSKKSFSESITLSESKTKRIVLPNTGTLTLSEASIRKPRLVRSEAFTLSDANAKREVVPKTDTVTLSEAKSKKPKTILADTLTLTEASIRKPTLRKTDILILSPDSMVAVYDETGAPPAINIFTLSIKDFMSSAESFGSGPTGTGFIRAYAETLLLSDLASQKPVLPISDSLSLSESTAKIPKLIRSETISAGDALVLKPGKILSNIFSLTDVRIKGIYLPKTDIFSIIDQISKRFIPQQKADGLTLSEAALLKPLMRRVFSEIMTLTDVQSRIKTFRRVFPDSFTLSDYAINNLIQVLWNRKAIVMSLTNYAVSEYPNYNFNSLVQFNDVLLGANENGIYTLSGGHDLGVDIQANIESGLFDFREDGEIKYPREGWLFYRADGNLSLIIKCDEDAEYETILANIGTHIKEIRAKFGKGIKSRAFNFELKNVDGSDFDVQSLRILGEKIPSRKR